jgi:FG-GAP-like repeat
MNTSSRRAGRVWPWLLALAAAAAAATAVLLRSPRQDHPPPPAPPPENHADLAAEVHRFCGHCHRYPPPDSFPRRAWRMEVGRGYQFYENSGLALHPPPLDEVVRYYEERASEELSLPTFLPPDHPSPARFERYGFPGPAAQPKVSNVNITCLSDPQRPELIACDMRHGRVMALRPWDPEPAWRVLGHVPNPAHAEVVDLDGDGFKDLLVANLGSFLPTDSRCGSVVWLRGGKDGKYTPYTLLDNVGRVADVRAADFRGTGKLDLIVACFGWNEVGEIILLENHTTDWSQPRFVPRVLDTRHGTIHVPVIDLNGDGRPDFVALISQEHETIVAFINEGNGKFTSKTLFEGAHPGLGSSGIELVDLNDDGHPDILYTHGDVLDQPCLLKPYHGVDWLENKGELHFEHHELTTMFGVHRALAADFCGRGLKDIIAVAFLPEEGFPQRSDQKLDAVILLEQMRPGEFVRHTLETATCDHVSCALGDLYGSGRMDVAIGNFGGSDTPVTIWKNIGAAKTQRDKP